MSLEAAAFSYRFLMVSHSSLSSVFIDNKLIMNVSNTRMLMKKKYELLISLLNPSGTTKYKSTIMYETIKTKMITSVRSVLSILILNQFHQ